MKPFSVPYNGESLDIFFSRLNPYREHIHDIFFSLPGIEDFFASCFNESYYSRCKEILESDIPYNRVVTVNGHYSILPEEEKKKFIVGVIKSLSQFKNAIYGVVISDFDVARAIHNEFPSLVLNTSCNVVQYSLSHLDAYREHCGITLINPPRDAARNLPLLRQFKEAGYRIKLLLNELCYFKCPNICSFCRASHNDYSCYIANNEVSPLKSCIVLPNWLDDFDEVVDIYKLTGRYMPTDYIINMLDIYVNRRNVLFKELVPTNLPIGNVRVLEISNQPIMCDRSCASCHYCDSFK